MTDYLERVLPVVTKYAVKVLMDEQRVQDAIGNSWYQYQQTDRRLEITASAFARTAVGWVLARRDLPGTGAGGHLQDALDRPDTWRGGHLGMVAAKDAGPVETAIQREALERLEGLSPRLRAILEMNQEGLKGREIAHKLGLTAGRVSQLLSEVKQKLRG